MKTRTKTHLSYFHSGRFLVHVLIGALGLSGLLWAVDDDRTYWVVAGDKPVLRVQNTLGRFEVSKRGREVSVSLNGNRLPSASVRQIGRIYRVFDAASRQVLLFGVYPGPGDGQLVYSPHLDPHALQGLTGLDIVEKDVSDLRALFPAGRSGEIVAIRKVAMGSAAAKAGLTGGQLLLSCNGRRIASPSALTGCLTAASSRLSLEVMEAGSTRQIILRLPSAPDWPDVREAQRLFSQALGR